MVVDEPQILKLKIKGEKVVTAGDIEANSNVEIVNPEEILAHLTSKSAELDVEVSVQRGLGYSAVESRKEEEKLAIGTIAIDAFFSPVTKVSYSVENMRVGDRTDYNRLTLEIYTDGTISPSAALHKSSNVLLDHFKAISEVSIQDFEEAKPEEKSKKKATSKKAKKEEE